MQRGIGLVLTRWRDCHGDLQVLDADDLMKYSPHLLYEIPEVRISSTMLCELNKDGKT